MDWYLLAKFLHIVCAIVWLGGGLALTILAVRADRANDDADLVRVVQSVVYLSPRMIVPASALTLVFGLIMVWLGQSFSDLWIVLALSGFVASLVLGVGFLKPMGERVEEMVAREGVGPTAAGQARHLLRHVKFDMVLLYTILADMVFKPTADDVGLLAVMAAVLLAAAMVFLGGSRRPVAARA